MASLQREIMLLRNDLNFERYLKQQHLTHIGQLQRKHIKEATAEADTLSLINTNRTLKARLAKANELYAQLKKETMTSRSQSKKWETELSSKVKSYREDQKVWQGDEETLRFNLKKTQQDCEHLKRMVERAESEQLKAQQRTRALEFELEDYGNTRRELEIAQDKILSLEDQSRELKPLMRERDELRNELEVANMRLNSREMERERAIKAYERKFMELESRLQAAEKNTGTWPVGAKWLPETAG
jgi:chromosome segregation ATPase